MRRGAVRMLWASVLAGAAIFVSATGASAHPLGNFTVNLYTGVRVAVERTDIDLVVDMAEIPTFQARRDIDRNGDGRVSDDEGAAYAGDACTQAARHLDVSVAGHPVPLDVASAKVTFPPGVAGLATLRLSCAVVAEPGRLEAEQDLVVRNDNYRDRIGWREMAAVGDGVTVVAADVGRASISDRLRRYPDDLLQSPPDQRTATLRVRPGGPRAPADFAPDSPATEPRARGLDRATRSFTQLVSRQHVTPVFALGALLASLILGAVHALAPGHGKTVMAAYLVGRRGSLRQAIYMGATVTATHTAGILVLGVVLSASTSLAPESVYPWLGLVSGLLLVGIGVGLLRSARRAAVLIPMHEPSLVGADHHHHHALQGHAHGAGHAHPHHHAHDGAPEPMIGWRGLLTLGLAGGIVPSPSALVVLLGAIALGRAWFGVALVVGYGIGMATALIGAGLLLVRFRATLEKRLSSRSPGRWTSLARALPTVTAALILGVGLILVARALATL